MRRQLFKCLIPLLFLVSAGVVLPSYAQTLNYNLQIRYEAASVNVVSEQAKLLLTTALLKLDRNNVFYTEYKLEPDKFTVYLATRQEQNEAFRLLNSFRFGVTDVDVAKESYQNKSFPVTVKFGRDFLSQVNELINENIAEVLVYYARANGINEKISTEWDSGEVKLTLYHEEGSDLLRASDLLSTPPQYRLELRRVDASKASINAIRDNRDLPEGSDLYTSTDGSAIALYSKSYITEKNIVWVAFQEERDSVPSGVSLFLDDEGAELLYQLTQESIGQKVAIVLFENDVGRVLKVAAINEPISDGALFISVGRSYLNELKQLTALLWYASLKEPILKLSSAAPI